MIKGKSISRFAGLRQLHRFMRDEQGTLIVFGLVLTVVMLMGGGLAVDLMRHEERRTEIQQTLDRSVLAATNMSQKLDPEDVVNDYFDKAGLLSQLSNVQVEEGLNFRRVTAQAQSDVPTYFMHLMDIQNLPVNAGSAAEQRITNVEISLVLDISGSMQNQPTRISNLRVAAAEFVDTVLSKDSEGKISISLIPYNGQVNLGSALFAEFNASNTHNFPKSHCLDLPSSIYDTDELSTSTSFPQSGFFDSFSGGGTSANAYTAYSGPLHNGTSYVNVWCQPNADNIIRPFQNDIASLQGAIDNLIAVGATSIDLGMKWGLALLSPTSRDVITNLNTNGIVPDDFIGRPLDFDAEDTMKIIVLMTDGQHFAEERLNDDFRSGPSEIRRSKGDGMLSIRHFESGANYGRYWVPHLGRWMDDPWNSGKGVNRLDWSEVWAEYRMQWIARQLYARAFGGNNSSWRNFHFNQAMNNFRSRTPTGEMDTRLQEVCSVAKANDILIYGIAFEAPENGATQIQNCATTADSHYYYVTTDGEGLSIQSAFRSIANNISQLRLTQ
ncbi:MAG: pilus assembly protein TadG-related protein [Pseudorhodobacter sp.]